MNRKELLEWVDGVESVLADWRRENPKNLRGHENEDAEALSAIRAMLEDKEPSEEEGEDMLQEFDQMLHNCRHDMGLNVESCDGCLGADLSKKLRALLASAKRPRVTREEVAWAIDTAYGLMGNGGAAKYMIGWLRDKGVQVEVEEEDNAKPILSSAEGCEWLKCRWWDGKICTDPNEYVNESEEAVCGRRDDAILREASPCPEK